MDAYTLTEKSQTFTVPQTSAFKLNAGHTGVYRVNYPMEIIKLFGEEVKKGKEGLLRSTADRVGLLADAGNLCVSGEQPTTAFLELAQTFINEQDYL